MIRSTRTLAFAVGFGFVVSGIFGFAVFGKTRETPDRTVAARRGIVAQSSPVADVELNRIRTSVYRDRRFSEADRKFALQAVNDPSLLVRHQAIIALEVATDAGLFSRRELLAIIESKTKKADPLETRLYDSAYSSVLHLRILPSAPFDSRRKVLEATTSDPKKLDDVERSFVETALADPAFENQRLAGRIFVGKSGLDAKDAREVLALVRRQIQRTRADQQEYWRFVERVVAFRNLR